MASTPKGKKGKMSEADSDGECPKKLRSADEEERRASMMSPGNKLAGTNGLRGRGSDKPAELFRKDLISAMKLADSEPLLPEAYLVISDPWRQEWERGVQVPVNPEFRHTISVNVKSANEKLHGNYPFKVPKKLLHAQKDDLYQQGLHELHETHKLAEQVCRYDLDDLDVTWLSSLNEEREAMGLPIIEEWVMEKVLEEIELQCHEKMSEMIKTVEGLGIEYDENVVCDVCRSPDSEDGNEMVFCDSCDICVHQACYGIQSIPDGSWLCRTCALGIRPLCILCPKTGGAMKSTKSGSKWAHVQCALWIPEVSIGCAEKMEPITKISHIPSSRWSLICGVCRDRSGACIQCSVKCCKNSFHVTCAFQSNFEMRTILEDTDEEIQLKAYCSKHTKKLRGEDGSPVKESCLSPSTPKKESEMTEEEKMELRSHRLQRLSEEFYRCVNIEKLAEATQMPEEMMDFIYNYWILKRKSEFNRPLLTPKTEEEELLNKQQEDSLIARMKMFVHLRQDLERVRNLCYMVSRREKIRRHLYVLKEQIFWRQDALLADPNQRFGSRETAVICRAHVLQENIYDCHSRILELAQDEDPELDLADIDHDLEHVKVRRDTGLSRIRRDSVLQVDEPGKRERQPSITAADKKDKQKEKELKYKMHSVFQRRNGLREREPDAKVVKAEGDAKPLPKEAADVVVDDTGESSKSCPVQVKTEPVADPETQQQELEDKPSGDTEGNAENLVTAGETMAAKLGDELESREKSQEKPSESENGARAKKKHNGQTAEGSGHGGKPGRRRRGEHFDTAKKVAKNQSDGENELLGKVTKKKTVDEMSPLNDDESDFLLNPGSEGQDKDSSLEGDKEDNNHIRESRRESRRSAAVAKVTKLELSPHKPVTPPKREKPELRKHSPRSGDPAPLESGSATRRPLESNGPHLKERNTPPIQDTDGLKTKEVIRRNDRKRIKNSRRHRAHVNKPVKLPRRQRRHRKSELNGIIPDSKLVVSESMKMKVQHRLLKANKRINQHSNQHRLELLIRSRRSQENIPAHTLQAAGLYLDPDGAGEGVSARSSRRSSLSRDIGSNKTSHSDMDMSVLHSKRRKLESDVESIASDSIDGDRSLRSSRSGTPDPDYALRRTRPDRLLNPTALELRLQQEMAQDDLIPSEISHPMASLEDDVSDFLDSGSDASGYSTRLSRHRARDNLDTLSVESGASGSSRYGTRRGASRWSQGFSLIKR